MRFFAVKTHGRDAEVITLSRCVSKNEFNARLRREMVLKNSLPSAAVIHSDTLTQTSKDGASVMKN